MFALRCNAGLRMLSGFLTMYMAFLLRQYPLPGFEHRATLLMGLVIGAAGLGNTIGIGLGSDARKVTPSITVVVALLADAAAAVVAAVFYGLIPAIALGLMAVYASSATLTGATSRLFEPMKARAPISVPCLMKPS